MSNIDPKYRGKLVSVSYFRGRKIEVYENNDPNLDPDIIGVLLERGQRTPQNDHERSLLKEINEMKAKGLSIEFPFN
ncbi:hypothetical protein [Sphingobacterium yanglingense]|nr:hypothetical protein [Sphingobacterium yanglingense]